ncbi:hypothetical protein EZV62_021287 [Acer yangbiense]|uniref:NTF2 domain-containing protein n=1 Tax=Acer yangbiense TaxID=1000413 RepID=A0A5C7H526_9ROSI|nr:hypothetical protein EZV62_021287 [Acer yangbiense]
MAAAMQQAPTTPTADIVSNAFDHQYYLILRQSPELVHQFYQDVSKHGRPEEDGAMSITTTMQAINDKILSLDYEEFSAEITTVDAQESYNGSVVLVLVTGYLTGKDNGRRRKFTRRFFLAPQDKGYFVLNDVFRYVDDANQSSINNVEAPITPDHDVSPVQENHGDGTVEEEEAIHVAEVIDDTDHMDAESNSKIEEAPKKSFAYINVKVRKDLQLCAYTIISYTSFSEVGLPVNATHALVENEFKKFGTIRSGGIQIKMHKGFCSGFVEFEEETAVQSATEADQLHNTNSLFLWWKLEPWNLITSIGEVVYKNQKIHSPSSFRVEDAFSWAIGFHKDYKNANKPVLPIVSPHADLGGKWCPSVDGVYKINTDAAINERRKVIGVGVIIQNFSGQVFVSSIQRFSACFSPPMAKATIILKGLCFAIDSVLESDAMGGGFDHSSDSANADIGFVISDIVSLCS